MSIKHPLDYLPSKFWTWIDSASTDFDTFVESLATVDKAELLEFIWSYEEASAEFKDDRFHEFFDEGLSEDGIDDLAMWVIEQGKDKVHSIFDHPEKIPSRVDSPRGALSKAVRSYYMRFGGPVPFRSDT